MCMCVHVCACAWCVACVCKGACACECACACACARAHAEKLEAHCSVWRLMLVPYGLLLIVTCLSLCSSVSSLLHPYHIDLRSESPSADPYLNLPASTVFSARL